MKINGTTIKTPSTLQVDIMDIDGEAYRNAQGTMLRDRVAVKRKLNCTWNALTDAEMSTLLSAVVNQSFTVTYPDPQTGTDITKTFYVGDRNAPVYWIQNGEPLWKGLTMNWIEL